MEKDSIESANKVLQAVQEQGNRSKDEVKEVWLGIGTHPVHGEGLLCNPLSGNELIAWGTESKAALDDIIPMIEAIAAMQGIVCSVRRFIPAP